MLNMLTIHYNLIVTRDNVTKICHNAWSKVIRDNMIVIRDMEYLHVMLGYKSIITGSQ